MRFSILAEALVRDLWARPSVVTFRGTDYMQVTRNVIEAGRHERFASPAISSSSNRMAGTGARVCGQHAPLVVKQLSKGTQGRDGG
jgi:hypothetical protein